MCLRSMAHQVAAFIQPLRGPIGLSPITLPDIPISDEANGLEAEACEASYTSRIESRIPTPGHKDKHEVVLEES